MTSLQEFQKQFAEKTKQELTTLLRYAGVPFKENANKDALALSLAQFMTTPALLRAAWNKLTDEEQELLEVMAEYGGYEEGMVAGLYARGDSLDRPDQDNEVIYLTRLLNETDTLMASDRSVQLAFFYNGVRINRQVLAMLPDVFPKSKPFPLEFQPSQKLVLIERETRVRELETLALFFAGDPHINEDHLPGKVAQSKFLGMSQHKDVVNRNRARSLDDLPITKLMLSMGPLMPYGDNGHIKEFFQGPPEQVVQNLLKKWLNSKDFKEYVFLPAFKVVWRKVHFSSIFNEMRNMLLTILAESPKSKWLNARSISMMVVTHNEHRLAEFFYSIDFDEIFEAIQFDLGVLVVLGILDGAWGEEGITGVRINALGAYLLGQTDTYTPGKLDAPLAASAFVVQPDYTVVLTGKRERKRHEAFLNQFLAPASSDESVSVYKLDFAAMAAALERGISVQQILDYLRANATKALPGNVETQLQDWEALSKKVHIRMAQVAIVECSDPFILAELKNTKAVQEKAFPVAENHLLVNANNVRAVKSAIEKRKYFCVVK